MESNGTKPGPRLDAGKNHSEPRDADLEHRETAVDARETEVQERETTVGAREHTVEARELTVEARELTVESRETAQRDRMDAAEGIRDAADKRDVVSGARDVAADKREHDLDQTDMLNAESNYGAHWPERRNAGLDRAHAKDDRTASHADRVAMTEGNNEPESNESSAHPPATAASPTYPQAVM